MTMTRADQAVTQLSVDVAGGVVLVTDGHTRWLADEAAYDAAHDALDSQSAIGDDEGGAEAYTELCRLVAARSAIASPDAGSAHGAAAAQEALVLRAIDAGLVTLDDAVAYCPSGALAVSLSAQASGEYVQTRAEQAMQDVRAVEVDGQMEIRDGETRWRTTPEILAAALEVLALQPPCEDGEYDGCPGHIYAYADLCAEVRRISRTAIGADAVAVVEADQAGTAQAGYELVLRCASWVAGESTDGPDPVVTVAEQLRRIGAHETMATVEQATIARQMVSRLSSPVRPVVLAVSEARALADIDPTLVRVGRAWPHPATPQAVYEQLDPWCPCCQADSPAADAGGPEQICEECATCCQDGRTCGPAFAGAGTIDFGGRPPDAEPEEAEFLARVDALLDDPRPEPSGEWVRVHTIGGDAEHSDYSRQVRIAGDEGAEPRPGDVYVEPSASTRQRLAGRAEIIDPQHGGSRLPWCHSSAADRFESPPGRHYEEERADAPYMGVPAAACTAAFYVGGHCRSRLSTIYVRADAGLDDYAAAAILADMVRPLPYGPEVRERLRLLAQADNVAWDDLQEWAPGQRLDDVTTTFPGLARICACVMLTARRRAELVAEWLMTGGVSPSTGELELLGTSEHAAASDDSRDYLDHLDRLAVAERTAEAPRVELLVGGGLWIGPLSPSADPVEVYRTRVPPGDTTVALVASPMRGLSAGRGAIGYGYQFAPVVVAVSPLRCPDSPTGECEPMATELSRCVYGKHPPRRLYTIAVAPHARSVRLDFSGLVAALNALEPGWGGNPSSRIIGSPKPQGSALDPETVARLVVRCVS
jgi:hypothetical protein